VTTALINTGPIVTRLFIKDESFKLLRDSCSLTKKEIINTESKDSWNFNTWVRGPAPNF